MYAPPPSLYVTVTLTFDLETPNSIGIIYMTDHHTKLEDPWAISSLVIDWTRFVYGTTDRRAKQYTPSSSKGDIINTIE